MEEIAQGAEARLYRERDILVKERVSKGYRAPELDHELRKSRTRHEAKLLEKLTGLNVPRLLKVSETTIWMEYIDGERLSRSLGLSSCRQIGTMVAALHERDIIHGDLTTSNMILKGKKLFFIDFGLAFHSTKIEDKAVDIHVLKQALQSRHYQVWEKAYRLFLKGYSEYSEHEAVLKRLEIVEKRGRNKH